MEQSDNLALPYMAASQNLKHVTHNEALRMVDALLHLSVLDRDRIEPPASPGAGDRHLIASGATGDWVGKDNQIAAWQMDAWVFYVPQNGWRVWVEAETSLYIWRETEWLSVTDELQDISLLGVNATADDTNRLTVSSSASLFNHEGAGHQIKNNKNASSDTNSLLFQTGFSGRAEMGCAGSDDFSFKVSPDGSNWFTGIEIDKDTGQVSFPSGGAREMLGASRIYHVDNTTGSDANDGLSSGAAFATIAKAIDVAGSLDANGFYVYIQLADGIWTEGFNINKFPVNGRLVLSGNVATPANCEISLTSGACIYCDVYSPWGIQFEGFKFTNTGGPAVDLRSGAVLTQGKVEYGTATSYAHIALTKSTLIWVSNYTISGDSQRHIIATVGSTVNWSSYTVTLTGTPNFSAFFIDLRHLSLAAGPAAPIWSGLATGARYQINGNSVIDTAGQGASYLPGDAVGTATTGGQYV